MRKESWVDCAGTTTLRNTQSYGSGTAQESHFWLANKPDVPGCLDSPACEEYVIQSQPMPRKLICLTVRDLWKNGMIDPPRTDRLGRHDRNPLRGVIVCVQLRPERASLQLDNRRITEASDR